MSYWNRPLFLLAVGTSSLCCAHGSGASLDFSDYEPEAIVLRGDSEGSGSRPTKGSADLTQSGATTGFVVLAATGAGGGSSFEGKIVSEPDGQSLRLTDIQSAGVQRPFIYLSTNEPYDPRSSTKPRTWAVDLNIRKSGDPGEGPLCVGLVSFDRVRPSGGYSSMQVPGSSGTSAETAMGLLFSINPTQGGNTLSVRRTGSSESASIQSWNGREWVNGTPNVKISWSTDTWYRFSFEYSAEDKALTATMSMAETGAELLRVNSSLDAISDQALAGGIRFVAGNINDNGSRNWVVDLRSPKIEDSAP